MSLPGFNGQRSFFDVDQICRGLFQEENGVPTDRYAVFAKEIWPKLAALRPRLEGMYCQENGRPAEEPVRMLAVLILQYMERLPDRQAAEASAYDLRWKLALHLEANGEGFHPTSLVKFRERLLEHGLERIGFEGVLAGLIEKGWVKPQAKQRLDSTHVMGLVARMSRLERMRETIRLALEALAEVEPKPESWAVWRERYAESRPDYKSPEDVLRGKLMQAGEDGERILAWAGGLPEAVREAEAVRLLRRVIEETFTKEEGAGRDIRRPTPPGAVQNPHDPEAHWSTKASPGASEAAKQKKTWVGYKAQVSETVQEKPREKGEPTANFITAMVTQGATESEDAGLAQTLAEQAKVGLGAPATLYVDAGYVSAPVLAEAQAEGRELKGPAPRGAEYGRHYSSEAFDVDVEHRRAVCRQGNASTNCSRLEVEATGKTNYRFEWSTAACRACPVRAKCVDDRLPHRTLVVGEHHTLLQARRREMRTETFREEMKRRNGIEGTHSEMVRGYGLRWARYRGLAKVRLQNYLIGAACNVARWFRRLLWLARQTGAGPPWQEIAQTA